MNEPSSEPASEPSEPASDPNAIDGRPLQELLPTGTLRILVAAAMVGAVVWSFAKFGFTGHALLGAVLTPALVLLAAIDARNKLLPNVIVFPTTLAVAVILLASAPGSFLGHLAVALAAGGFFFAFAAFFPGSLGLGDAKLVFLLGLALGSKTLGALILAFFAIGAAAVYVVARRGTAARKETIAFGPFLALAGLVAFFLG
ncbi:MAG TPA: A24 family peptidase [Gaiellaceae bacterium]|nr:A24 family peptidase [Gaiellaceae bacterium]